MTDSFKARTTLEVGERRYAICGLGALKANNVDRLPFSLKILLENLLRFEAEHFGIIADDARQFSGIGASAAADDVGAA